MIYYISGPQDHILNFICLINAYYENDKIDNSKPSVHWCLTP